jgi:hypothetical protein
MKNENRKLAITVIVTICIAFIFIYSWSHEGSPRYLQSGRRITSSTEVLGAALFYFFMAIISQIRKR